ncbi:MAG: hypothetical protein U9N61_07150, partial [Euryarchaeota archaeon]|nr:hypothetical protein [Euryarchaeota archaeon]
FIDVTNGYRIQILDSGENCFRMVGDAKLNQKINPIPDCSQHNCLCYGPEMNIKLFNCYWDDGCWCFMQECPCGCTDDLPECDSCETGTIHTDVDNINNNKPQPGVKIYLDDAYQGTTDSFGKKDVDARYGSHTIMVKCPDGTDCGLQEFYVNGDEYLYFDCDCDTHLAALQVNVDNINGYPVANVYVYVDGEERALTCPFGYAYIEDVPYGDHRIDIRYSITNPDYIGDYQKSLDITVDEEKEVVNLIATLPDKSQLAQARSLGDSSSFTRIENFTPQVLPLAAAAMAVIDIASVTWSTDEFCRCMFQEEGSSGIEQCISAMSGCTGDIRGCIGQIRENAGPAANRCKFEGAMLVGDVASPFIPVKIASHTIAKVVGEGGVLKIVDNIGEGGRIVKTKAGGVVEYVKDGIARFAKWFDDLGIFKKCIVEGTEHWSDDALSGLESIARAGGEGPEGKAVAEKFVKILKDEVSDEYAEKIAKNVKELQNKGITGANKLVGEIASASKNENWNQLKGAVFEAEVAVDSRYIDDVVEVRKKIPKGEIDILLKNDDIVEAKNLDWSKMNRVKFNDHKNKLGDQIRKYRGYQINTLNNPDAEIKVVFKNEDSYWYPEMKAFLEDDKGVLVEVLWDG